MRQIVLDTETTGLEPSEGHRIIEIGCVELIDRQITQFTFHCYLNPDRAVDEGAAQVHGLSDAFLSDKPRFAAIVEDFLAYIKGAELLIHNAPFDVAFLDHELKLHDQKHQTQLGSLSQYCTVTDTLVLARKKHPGQRNSLDALCKRYEIDNSHRELHGALLDSEILADVYLSMTGGQITLDLSLDQAIETPVITSITNKAVSSEVVTIETSTREKPVLRVVKAHEEELIEHNKLLDQINDRGGCCLWQELDG